MNTSRALEAVDYPPNHVLWHSLSQPPFQRGLWVTCLSCGTQVFIAAEETRRKA